MTARAAAVAAATLLAGTALAGDAIDPRRVRAARDAVFARPEFRYTTADEGDSLLRRALGWWQDLVSGFQAEHPVLFVVLLVGAALLLVLLLAHIAWTWRTARRIRFESEDPHDLEAALRRLDPAPFRTRALAEAAAGRLDDAIRDLYTALLLTLDRRGSARYAGHKALLDYRIETAGDTAARTVLDRFAAAYPPGSFGRRPPDASRFRELVAALDALAVPAESVA